ncbi:hypothetical protein ASU31_10695 [Pedobacter ginsenosidimutans]|uniref:Cthe-2314-like HEPN domain-containing protein n=1 Tax=Pedobacter ginsenosidimutans TaxID=687842 RepID=A0A0T5VQ62_9SPHI|nr:hypothetical protein [Pedobacter ginsenosidimutans]KRT15968.1 hypothetical protein ASU31_10695 [Pedobacter ginsenosidimutans]
MKYDLPLSNTLYLKNLKSYLKLADDNLATFKQQNKEFTQRLVREEAQTDWLDEGSHLNNIEWLFLNSIYVTLYASFEHFLFKVASTLEHQTGINIKLIDIAGEGILAKYTRYLYLVGGIASASRELAIWGRMKHYQNVRNLLAHNGGMMQDKSTKQIEQHKDFQFLKSEDVIMAGGFGHIRIRNTKILQSFASDTALLTNQILKEFNFKYSSKE